jgi:hypothetical protein
VFFPFVIDTARAGADLLPDLVLLRACSSGVHPTLRAAAFCTSKYGPGPLSQ